MTGDLCFTNQQCKQFYKGNLANLVVGNQTITLCPGPQPPGPDPFPSCKPPWRKGVIQEF